MIKRITVGIFLLMLSSQFLFSQENLSENQKLETLGKIWGFLKYYHPNVAKGTFNWDNQLIEKMKESEKIDDKTQFNKMISEWIDGLGKVEICKTCNVKNDKKYFLKNFDLSWTDDENTFSRNVIEKLNFIEKNRNTNAQYYVNSVPNTGQINLTNEINYSEEFPESNIQLVELFRYWNLVEYFFPYKYKTDQKWDTQSHAEFSTMILQTFPNSKVIGSQTSGADGNVSKFNLAGKPTVFTGLGVFYSDGRETQRIGIVPDIEVKPTIKGLQENRDEVLDRALEYIKTGK